MRTHADAFPARARPDSLSELAAIVPAGDDRPGIGVEAPYSGDRIGEIPACSPADVEPAMLDYFVHPTSYTCQNALGDLRGSGIACPPFESYVERLVRFYREHPEISSDAMV